jgi:hypothetical protein
MLPMWNIGSGTITPAIRGTGDDPIGVFARASLDGYLRARGAATSLATLVLA